MLTNGVLHARINYRVKINIKEMYASSAKACVSAANARGAQK